MAIRKYKRKDKEGNICTPYTVFSQVVDDTTGKSLTGTITTLNTNINKIQTNTNNLVAKFDTLKLAVDECESATNHMVYLGEFDESKGGEDAAIQYASNRKISLITYDVKDGPTCRIEQTFSNTSATIQYLYYNGRRYVRQISWANNNVGNWVDVTGAERIKKLVFNSSNNTLSFEDALDPNINWGSVNIPIPNIPIVPSAQEKGVDASHDNYTYIYKGATVSSKETSTDVVSDINLNTSTTEVKFVTKSWGTNTWNERCKITAATSGKSGVMTAAQCSKLETLDSFLTKLTTAFGTTDLDTIVNKLATLK